jgi:predicted nuclease of predicted toxin-antitoxin system
MRFLADENFPGAAVDALVRAGHDVVWIATIARGMPDNEVFRWAAREGRIILTFDKDFGQIARGASLPDSCGIIYFAFRCHHRPRSEPALRISWAADSIGRATSR